MTDYNWDHLDKVYSSPNKDILKGKVINLLINCKKPIGEINSEILEGFFRSWTYSISGKYIKPFEFHEFTCSGSRMSIKITLKKKNENTDELKLLLQDVLDYLNSDHIPVSKIEAIIE
ncbi:hypothetical protein [Paenibacillus sp. FSL R7-0331]|uniref:hypothetical protein n=1 Tax=Paenibacillus sp. FSL R7-0331 TaxID=1536773 RepID=UPI0004F86F3D|nr:hypothetical protein [Paenibacillus sp. FSL R7-0331]AIQ54612.1 hypothetical protein R70331_25960 [Paenibacillus sp. FSL R7-0331]